MKSAMRLLASLASPYTRKVRVVLAEKRIDCEMQLVEVQPVDNAVNPHNPLGKIPHGERYSLADIAVGCCVGWLGFRKPGGVDWQARYPALGRHYQKLMERPAFNTVSQIPK